MDEKKLTLLARMESKQQALFEHGPQQCQMKELKLENPGLLNPEWAEWFMGWPMGWTELAPLEMDKFLEWQRWHGVF